MTFFYKNNFPIVNFQKFRHKTPWSESESGFGYRPALNSEKYLDLGPGSVNPHPKHCFKKVITNSDTENGQFLKKNMAPGNYRALQIYIERGTGTRYRTILIINRLK